MLHAVVMAGGSGTRFWPAFGLALQGLGRGLDTGNFLRASKSGVLGKLGRKKRGAHEVVWGVDIGDDAVCYTDDFIGVNDGLINAKIGGRDIVIAYDPQYESVGAWYNDSGKPVSEIDFFGRSDQGQLKRVETLKPGMFWHVWAEFYPHTDINRVG